MSKLTVQLEQTLGVKAHIDHVRLHWFRRLSVEGVYLSDVKGDSLLYAEKVNARLSILPLFEKKIVLRTVGIEHPRISISVDSAGVSNLAFLSKLSSSGQGMAFTIHVDAVEIDDGTLTFTSARGDQTATVGKFRPNHIRVTNLNTRLTIDEIATNLYQGAIHKLNFLEQSGFELTNFTTTFNISDSLCLITGTNLMLPETDLRLDTIRLKYQHLATVVDSFENARFSASIAPSVITASDLKAFEPMLAGINRQLRLRGLFHGTLGNVRLSDLNLTYGSDLLFNGDAQLTGLPNVDETYVYARINRMEANVAGVQDLVAGLTRKPVVLPKELHNLRRCSYNGKIYGFFSNLVLEGELKTGIGSVRTDVALMLDKGFDNLRLDGAVRSNGLNLAAITPKNSGLGKIAFDAHASFHLDSHNQIEVHGRLNVASFDYNGHAYKDLAVNGDYENKIFTGAINLNDEHANVHFDGMVDLRDKVRKFNFYASVDQLSPNGLRLTDKLPNFVTSFTVRADFEGERLEMAQGFVRLDSIEIVNNGAFYMDSLVLRSERSENATMTTIESDLINGNVSGDYLYSSIPGNFSNILKRYMPILGYDSKNVRKVEHKEPFSNDMRLYIEIAPTAELCDVMEIPWTTVETTTLSGFYNDSHSSFNLELNVPSLKNGPRSFDQTLLRCYNVNDRINILAHTLTNTKSDSLDITLNVALSNDTIATDLNWRNILHEENFAGEFVAKTFLFMQNDSLYLDNQILPTQAIISGEEWDIKRASILTNLKWVEINDLYILTRNQHIYVDGRASDSPDDKVHVSLKDIDLGNLMENLLADDTSISMGGLVSGTADVASVFKRPILEADVTSENFMFDNAQFGHVHATSSFDNDAQSLLFHGTVMPNGKDTAAVLDGFYAFSNDSLDIKADARYFDLRFINFYTEGIVNIESGFGKGWAHIHGHTKPSTIVVEAKAFVDKGKIGVDFLNASFSFADTISLTKNGLQFDNIVLYDSEGNRGKLNGGLTYEYFKNMKFDLAIDADKMLILDTKPEPGSVFYGKAYASGKARIWGDEDKVNVTCNVVSEPKTHVVIPVDANYSATENTFITFVEKEPQKHKLTTVEKPVEPKKGSEINLDLTIDVRPSAEIGLIIDSHSGDMITANGEGTIRMIYNDRNEILKMHGALSITQGKYLFTFQNAIRREFHVTEGSSLSWSGAPENPSVNINAWYQTTASLVDVLDQTVLANTNKKSALVQCLLHMSGNLMQPVLKFDINLPNSDEEITRAVKNVVNTDELMMRQIIYLLVANKFYPVDYLRSSTSSSSAAQSEIFSVVASTVSAQLNNWASQLFKGWDLGVNIRTSGEGSTRSNEYEVVIAYMPNDRITINGNVGYRDDNLSASKFIGDVDVEYKLLQSGKLSAKAYTHTNDYSEFKEALTTQGVGLVYRESFNSLPELWRSWKTDSSERKAERQKRREERKKRKEQSKSDKAIKQKEAIIEEEAATPTPTSK